MKPGAIIINDNYLSPDNYKHFMAPVKEQQYVTLFKWRIPTGKKTVGYEPAIKLRHAGKTITLADKKWLHTRILAKRGYPIILYETNDGDYEPVTIRRQDDDAAKEMQNTDKWRNFKKFVMFVDELTKSKWDKLGHVVIVVVLGILAVGALLAFSVLFNKFALDHTTILQGAANQTGNWITNGTMFLGG